MWDGQPEIWLSADARVNSTSEQEASDAGFADAARALRLPIRKDGALPSDVLDQSQLEALDDPAALAHREAMRTASAHEMASSDGECQLSESALSRINSCTRPAVASMSAACKRGNAAAGATKRASKPPLAFASVRGEYGLSKANTAPVSSAR